jgi:putative exosortase-associated protein (TIGR04073 family)
MVVIWVRLLQQFIFMRNTVFILGASILVAVLAAGCAGSEEKLGRGFSNMTEPMRAGEFARAEEQNSLFDGPDSGFAGGFVQGVDKTVARTGIGIFEVVTFPLPPYHPLCTDYLTPRPQHPDAYRARKWADPMFDTDQYIGFSGGDICPWFPGSHFRIFDN